MCYNKPITYLCKYICHHTHIKKTIPPSIIHNLIDLNASFLFFNNKIISIKPFNSQNKKQNPIVAVLYVFNFAINNKIHK